MFLKVCCTELRLIDIVDVSKYSLCAFSWQHPVLQFIGSIDCDKSQAHKGNALGECLCLSNLWQHEPFNRNSGVLVLQSQQFQKRFFLISQTSNSNATCISATDITVTFVLDTNLWWTPTSESRRFLVCATVRSDALISVYHWTKIWDSWQTPEISN